MPHAERLTQQTICFPATDSFESADSSTYDSSFSRLFAWLPALMAVVGLVLPCVSAISAWVILPMVMPLSLQAIQAVMDPLQLSSFSDAHELQRQIDEDLW